jgi:hypothetical protein
MSFKQKNIFEALIFECRQKYIKAGKILYFCGGSNSPGGDFERLNELC